jgi:hypothetical protein
MKTRPQKISARLSAAFHARSGITRKSARRAGGQIRFQKSLCRFANADFTRYLIGRFVASLGQQMLVVAIDWELYQRTHSALALAFVGLSLMIPMILCTIPAGHFADTFNRKKIILITTLVLAVASVGLTLIILFRRERVLDLHLPGRPWRGADFSLAGQRGVRHQPRAAEANLPARSRSTAARFNFPPSSARRRLARSSR